MAEIKIRQLQIASSEYTGPGVSVDPEGITFTAAAENDEPFSLILYKRGTDEVLGQFPMESDPWTGAMRRVKITGVAPDEIEYNYHAGTKIITDPAAPVVSGRSIFGDMSERKPGQVRGALNGLKFDWHEDKPLMIPYENVISYLIHVRGFTMQKGSKVRHKGTFKGIIEKIPYLKELGINQLILMPAYDFDEIQTDVRAAVYDPAGGLKDRPNSKKLNYWGYGSGNYYAPKASYAAGDHPSTEFKTMVRTLHESGIEVIMEMAFGDNMDITFVTRCLKNWVREYHVDGFVLMANQNICEQVAKCPSLTNTKLITGYFDPNRVYPRGRRFAYRNLADFNDGFKNDCRRILKSDEGMLQAFVDRMRQNGRDKGVINYIANHDGFTLADLVSYDKKHNEDNGELGRDGAETDYSWNCGIEGPTRKRNVTTLRTRQMKNAMAMLLLAQGTPMILAGDEFANSQSGNNNPWCIDSEVTWLDWSHAKSNAELTDFVKTLIAFRKEHPILHTARPLTGNDQASCGFPDFSVHSSRAWYGAYEYQNRHAGLMYCGRAERGDRSEEEFIYIAYNFHWDEQTLAMPYPPDGMAWQIKLSTSGDEDKEGIYHVRELEVPGRSVQVLVAVKKAAEKALEADEKAQAAEVTESTEVAVDAEKTE